MLPVVTTCINTGALKCRFFSGPAQTMRGEEARKGQEWFALGWQEREKKLFNLADEVAAKRAPK